MDTFKCQGCGREFEKGRSDEDAEIEAMQLFGVSQASDDPQMAVVCDECFNRIMAENASIESWLMLL